MPVLFASTHRAGHFGLLIPLIDACWGTATRRSSSGPPTLCPRPSRRPSGARAPVDRGNDVGSARCRTTCESSGGSTSRRSRDVAAAHAGVVARSRGSGTGGSSSWSPAAA